MFQVVPHVVDNKEDIGIHIEQFNNLKIKIMTEVEKFYEWMLQMNSIHLADNYKMTKAYEIVYDNSIELKKPKKNKKCTQSI